MFMHTRKRRLRIYLFKILLENIFLTRHNRHVRSTTYYWIQLLGLFNTLAFPFKLLIQTVDWCLGSKFFFVCFLFSQSSMLSTVLLIKLTEITPTVQFICIFNHIVFENIAITSKVATFLYARWGKYQLTQ